MPLICYTPRKFDAGSKAVIDTANGILNEYAGQGYDLTLRQLYYQFVSRGIIPNKDTEYKRLGSIVNDARLAGMIDWDHITDRTRNIRSSAHWSSPRDIVSACAAQYQTDKWSTQSNYVEVWVEKDALVGVLEVACKPLDVPYFSCRGYTSQSEMWAASQRLLRMIEKGKRVTIIHLGDHDPSGIDMSRDIEDRLTLFVSHHAVRRYIKQNPRGNDETPDEYSERVTPKWDQIRTGLITVNRIALNMDQIEEYEPPPNPAKLTDARARKYVEEYGDSSWELDALEPSVITNLIEGAVGELLDADAWDTAVEQEDAHKDELRMCSDQWDKVVKYLAKKGKSE